MENTWKFKFDSSEGLFKREDKDLSNVNINRLTKIVKNGVDILMVNFKDRTDEMEMIKSTRKVMDYWIRKYYSSFDDQPVNFFTLFEYDEEDSGTTNITYKLRKPINQMSDEEKNCLRTILDNVGVDDLSDLGFEK